MVTPGVLDYFGCPADVDNDGDGLNNGDDNCPLTSNPEQIDLDWDGIGSACDSDETIRTDGCNLQNDGDCDGVLNGDDRCPFVIGDPGNELGCLDVAVEQAPELIQEILGMNEVQGIEIIDPDGLYCDYHYSVNARLSIPPAYRRWIRNVPVTIKYLTESGQVLMTNSITSRIRNNNRTRVTDSLTVYTREGGIYGYAPDLPVSIEVRSVGGSEVLRADLTQGSRECVAELDPLFALVRTSGSYVNLVVDAQPSGDDGVTLSGWGNILGTQR